MKETDIQALQRKYRDVPPEFHSDFVRVKPFTMVKASRSYALWEAVNYVSRANIPGSFVECGVWRGGQAMLAALAFMRNDRYPDFHLFDTFAGMAAPDEIDVRAKTGRRALEKWKTHQLGNHNEWAYAPVDEVRANMASMGYPDDKIHYHIGMVEDTLQSCSIERICILRLDTDWYSSTKVEMETLFPRVTSGGVLILDDYGTWQGARTAVDEYLADNRIHLYLARVDTAGRVAIKP